MIATIEYQNKFYKVNLAEGLDISLGIGNTQKANVRCYYASEAKLGPITTDQFIGSINEGFSVNYYEATINPHGQGTHTECVGHISPEMEKVSDCLTQFHFLSTLISVKPSKIDLEDLVISKDSLELHNIPKATDALIIRTMPNFSAKKHTDYSGTNPTYLTKEAMEYIVELGVKHLLVDLPSVDRETDGGKLQAHNIFWKGDRSTFATLTELIFVPNEIEDGIYLLNLQLSTIELDAAPSRPILYKIM